MPLNIGAAVEFESKPEANELNFPVTFEYNLTERFKLVVEPNFVHIDSKRPDVRSVGGLGDTETAVEWEFVRERRFRPALTANGLIRWPTAINPDLGSAGRDYSGGLIASKDLVWADLDLNLLYTASGDPEQDDTIEIGLGAEWPVTRHLDIEGEVVPTFETGLRAQGPLASGAAAGGMVQTESTVGWAWHFNRYFKIEQGVLVRDDATWQVIFGWQWSLGGED